MKVFLKKFLLFTLVFTLLGAVVLPINETQADAGSYFRESLVIIKKRAGFVTDSLNGVKAVYRRGGNDGNSATYSCAAFVKKYYKKVYGKTVNNLFSGRTPRAYGDSFIKVKKPKVGDIAASNTNHGTTHWAIVKKVNSDGTVTLIEQNWKWQQGSTTYAKKNRKVKSSSIRFYRLKSQKKKAAKKAKRTVKKVTSNKSIKKNNQ